MPIERITKLKIKLLEDPNPQYIVAAKCRIHPTTISLYATGQARPSIAHLRALARYFHCRQQDILGWEEIEWELADEA